MDLPNFLTCYIWNEVADLCQKVIIIHFLILLMYENKKIKNRETVLFMNHKEEMIVKEIKDSELNLLHSH